MKIKAQASTLGAALSRAAATGRANKKNAAPVRIVASNGLVSVTCSGSHVAITAALTAEVIEPGQAAVAVDRLCSLIAAFAAGAAVTISTAESMTTIVCGNSRSRLPMIPIDDLPVVLAIDMEIGRVEISGADCLTLLEPAAVAANETTRFSLCGVFWHSVGDRLVAAASDGIRLIRVDIPAGKFSAEGLIVPREAAAVISGLVKRQGRLTLRRSRTLLAVVGPDFEYITRLIAADYPPYQAIVPADSPNAITCDRADLLATLWRLHAVALAEPTPLVALAFERAPQLRLYLARQPDDGADAIPAEARGATRIAAPLRQLADMINEFGSDRICIEAATGQPIVIHGDRGKLAVIAATAWDFGDSEKLETK
jgi:DNA polymerase-3 subunit beta